MLRKWLLTIVVLPALLASFVTGCSPAQTPDPLEEGLVAYFPFDGNANDLSGNGNHGTVSGASLITDRLGNNNHAYSFDGVDDKITVPQDHFITGNALTVSCWVKLDTGIVLPKMFIMCSDFGLASQDNNKITCVISVPDTKSAGGTVGFGSWNHFVGTFDGTEIKAYVNGSLIETVGHPGTINDTNRDLTFGYFNSAFWKGAVDEFRIYDRVLSQAEIIQLFTLD